MGVGSFKVLALLKDPGGRRNWLIKLPDPRGGYRVEFEERDIIHLKNDKQEGRPKQIITEGNSHFLFGYCSVLSISLHPSGPTSHRV